VFRYDQKLLEVFPTIRAGIIHATNLVNTPSPPALLELYQAQQAATAARLEETPVAEIPSIAAWRGAFSRSGVKPTQYRVAAEALLRRLSKYGEIPSINALVDIGNLVSIRYAMPLAVFDQRQIAPPTTVRFAVGDETFTDLGARDAGPTHPEADEVVFVDAAGVVSARRWCWRQSSQSATGPTTAEALFVVEGHHESAATDVAAALQDLDSLLAVHQPQSGRTLHHLSPASPAM
jgi:DNA/RNA-binding domain of Phe-tRNA-synthetase-like protein